MLSQLLVSGNEQHTQEQLWLLQLLATGLRAPQDAPLYRCLMPPNCFDHLLTTLLHSKPV